LGDIERQVMDAYDTLAGGASKPASIDDIVDASGLAASQVLATIGVLEMRRLIRRLPGNQIARI
jgi:DNA processing protein